MKLRILGNKVRLRLSMTEVSQLCAGESVSITVNFPLGNNLIYMVINNPELEKIEICYLENTISLSVPNKILSGWLDDDREGIYYKWETQQFEIALEKDFQCLHKRPGEDEKDNFQNPRN